MKSKFPSLDRSVSVSKFYEWSQQGRLLLLGILLAVGEMRAFADAKDPCHFSDWLKICQWKSSKVSHDKIDPEWGAVISSLEGRIDAKHLETEWRRLISEAETPSKEELGKALDIHLEARVTMATVFFENAVQSKELGLAKTILAMERVGFCRPLIKPEFFLVRKAGADAFQIVFDAYKEAKKWEVKTDLAAMVRRAFFYVYEDDDNTWPRLDTDDEVVRQREKWFSAVKSDLRPVEAYWPVSGTKVYYEQGKKDGEKLIGLFFMR